MARNNQGGRQQSHAQKRNFPSIVFLQDDGSGGKHIPKDLLTKTAEECAEIIFATGDKKNLKSHQLRRFYNDLKSVEKKVINQPEHFDRFWPLVGLMKAKVAYASNPKSPKIPSEFKDFIEKCVDQVDGDKEKFDVFCLFFEAVLGYLYGRGVANN